LDLGQAHVSLPPRRVQDRQGVAIRDADDTVISAAMATCATATASMSNASNSGANRCMLVRVHRNETKGNRPGTIILCQM
jgi:hypothetical protein